METLIAIVAIGTVILTGWAAYRLICWYCRRVTALNEFAKDKYRYTPINLRKTLAILASWILLAVAIGSLGSVRTLTFDLHSPEVNGIIAAIASLIAFKLIFRRIENKTSTWIAIQSMFFLSINAFSIFIVVAVTLAVLFYGKEEADLRKQRREAIERDLAGF